MQIHVTKQANSASLQHFTPHNLLGTAPASTVAAVARSARGILHVPYMIMS